MKHPLVSIIIPTYNRETYLNQAIESVSNQTYTSLEIIVVDDGSATQYAEALCKPYECCAYYKKENGGLSSARNFGISKAKGKYIAFLDDDDFWREDKLQKQVEVLETKPEIDLVHCAATVVDQQGGAAGVTIGASAGNEHKRTGQVFWNALGTWVVKSPTPLIRATVLQGHMLFDETIKVGEDIDFYQRFFYHHKVHYISEALASYRVYDNQQRLSLQAKKYVGIEKKMLKNFKQMGVSNPIILYKIAQKLSKQALRNWNKAFPDRTKKMNLFCYYITPSYYLNNAFTLEAEI